MHKSFIELIKQKFALPDVDMRLYSPLALAYIGDSVFDCIIRSMIVSQGNRGGQDLHRYTSGHVCAAAQALLVELLIPELDDKELGVYKRGRNAKTANTAKNASVQEYRKATGFEALIGYLYLQGQEERILDLIKLGMRKADENALH